MIPSVPAGNLDIRMTPEGLEDPTGNASAAETLLLNLGPKRDPLTTVIPMTLIYSVLLVSGVIGNVCTCIVIARNRYMHTATNYYLFSLAVSDLMLLVLGLPQELYQLWERHPYVFGEAFCILRGLTSETSTNASILTITAFTIERYVAICHPLRAHTMSKLSRAIKFVVVIWLLSALCAIPLAVQFGIVHQSVDGTTMLPESAVCTVKYPLEHAFELSTFGFFLLPMSVILVLYVCIALQLKRSDALSRQDVEHKCPVVTNGKSAEAGLKEVVQPVHKFQRGCQLRKSTRGGSGTSSSRKAVINMLIAVVVAFFLCWAPFHAQRLMAVYIKEPTPAHEMAFNLLTYISGVTYYVSATINPILYSIMSLKFRQAFRDTLMRCCGRRAARHGKSVSVTFPSGFRSTFRSSAAFETSDFTLLTDGLPPPYTVEALMNQRARNVIICIDECSEPASSRKASTISSSSMQMVAADAFEEAERLSDRMVELGSCG